MNRHPLLSEKDKQDENRPVKRIEMGSAGAIKYQATSSRGYEGAAAGGARAATCKSEAPGDGEQPSSETQYKPFYALGLGHDAVRAMDSYDAYVHTAPSCTLDPASDQRTELAPASAIPVKAPEASADTSRPLPGLNLSVRGSTAGAAPTVRAASGPAASAASNSLTPTPLDPQAAFEAAKRTVAIAPYEIRAR